MGESFRVRAFRYDLLNPDQRGGFVSIDRACLAFNSVIASAYVEITMHIETFERLNMQYILAYLGLTLLFVSINRIFFGDIYSYINMLRLEALNAVKEKVYGDDKLSFDILKYCYEQRLNKSAIANFIVKASAIGLSGAVKFWPVISKMLVKV